MNKEIKILSLSFLFIFFGFNGVQSYVTAFFADSLMIEVGFRSLILIYLFFILFDPLSAVFVSKYGAKKCMIMGSLFYSFYIFSLLAKSVYLIYIFSALLGIAASALWTGQNSYLIRTSDKNSYGAASGFFNSLQSAGSAIGVFLIGALVSRLSFSASFSIFSVLPVIGFFLLYGIRDLRVENKSDHFKLIKKSITSPTALKLSSLWFVGSFVFGLIIGIIPVQIKNILGISYIGVLSSLFFILPIMFSYFFGKLSDIKGRKEMIIFSYALLAVGLAVLLFSEERLFLISGVVLLALNWAITRPITYAFVGDVADGENLEFVTALFWMIQGVGTLAALILSQVFETQIAIVYLISILFTLVSFSIVFPLLQLSVEKIKEKISVEMR